MIYINKDIPFWEVQEILPETYQVGATLADFENGMFVLLTQEQEAFYQVHPEASQLEVFNMKIEPLPEPTPIPEPTELEIARKSKINEIINQDQKSNKFFISVTKGGQEIDNKELWLDRELRDSLFSNTLPALRADYGVTADGKCNGKTKLWTKTMPPQSVDVPIDWALEKLPLLEIYAKRTYDLRAQNIAAVYAAGSVQEVNAIDVKKDYPLYLTFELNLDLWV